MCDIAGDLVIRNGSLLLPDGCLRSCDVRIKAGRVDGIGAGLRSNSEIDASGAYILPGLIDLHTHGIGFQSASLGILAEYAKIEASCGAIAARPVAKSRKVSAATVLEYEKRAKEAGLTWPPTACDTSRQRLCSAST